VPRAHGSQRSAAGVYHDFRDLNVKRSLRPAREKQQLGPVGCGAVVAVDIRLADRIGQIGPIGSIETRSLLEQFLVGFQGEGAVFEAIEQIGSLPQHRSG